MARARLVEAVVGRGEGIAVSPREVTDRMRIERAMCQSDERLRAGVDAQLDPFAIYSAVRDRAGRLVDLRTEFINRAACDFSQIAAEDQRGHGLLELFPELASSRIVELYREVIETGESFAEDGLELNALFGAVAGPRHYDVRIVREGDGLVVSCRDVTRRLLASLTAAERQALARLARDLPHLWDAETTTARDRKELLRTLVGEVIVTVKDDPRRAEIEIVWEGGARTELQVPLIRRGGERHRTSEDTVDLIRRLAAHTNDQLIAAILNKQGRRTGTGLPFSQSRVKYVRQQHRIPAAPPPDPDNGLVTIEQAATQLGVSNATVYRWLRAGLVPGEQITPHAPWRIRLTDELRSRFVPAVPHGYLPLDEAAKRLGCARQTVLHKVQRGELHAVQVVAGRRKGLRIKVNGPEAGLFDK